MSERKEKSISAHFSHHSDLAHVVSVIGRVICFASLHELALPSKDFSHVLWCRQGKNQGLLFTATPEYRSFVRATLSLPRQGYPRLHLGE
jgi:hypothetical protein